MGRPDKTAERTGQILDAFARCIAREGVERTSLQDVADEAEVHKSIIRHYVGSRADLVTALSRRTIEQWRAELAQLRRLPPGRPRLDLLVDDLFAPETEPYENALFDALMRAPDAYPDATALWVDTFEEIAGWLREELGYVYSESSPEDRAVVASGVWGLALVVDEEMPVRALARDQLQAAATRLIDSLGSDR